MLAKRIKELRTHLGYTQEEFANAMGLSRRIVQRWEYAESDVAEYYLRLIQYTFNVNPEWLRQGKDKMFKPTASTDLKPIIEWMENLSDKESTWLRVDMEQRYELLQKWLKK